MDESYITEILRTKGPAALFDAVPEIYFELRRQASRMLRREKAPDLLQTTALLHETYLRLVADSQRSWQNRAHFMAIGAHLMRQILVDHARRRDAASRGGDCARIPLDDIEPGGQAPSVDVEALSEALDRLRELHGRQAQVIELRYFGGLTFDEIGEVLGVTPRTAKRDWHVARAWLYGTLAS